MKELVTSDSRPIPEAYEHVAIAIHMQYPVAASTLPTQTSLKSTLLRSRRSIYPPLPVAINNLHNIPDVFSNIGEDRFLLSNTLNEGQDGSLVFCTNDGLRLLHDHCTWYVDGIFKVAPRLFQQLRTIHLQVQNKVLPCEFAPLQAKSIYSYRRVLRNMKDACQAKPHPSSPDSVTMDFEAVLIQAARDDFLLANVHGCLFHFTQALWRKIQGLGLQEEYLQNDDLQASCRQFMAFLFLPVGDITLAFAYVSDIAV